MSQSISTAVVGMIIASARATRYDQEMPIK
jgi:hypothetical protein